MCGIAGVVDRRGPVSRDLLSAMAGPLSRRGPDDEGFHLSGGEQGPWAGLAFRRLSIIDLSGGAQPMTNEDGTLWIVFNGEIYNYRELRAELEAKGHPFRTTSDTEVILHLYEELGPEALQRMNGMFSFALWDQKTRRLLLARDRMGKKPLYYVESASGLLFASEPKALLKHPDVSRELDPAALRKYLAYEFVPSPHAIFRGMRKLTGGHYLLWQDGRADVRRYWNVPLGEPAPRRTESEWCGELRARLKESVRMRLVSDVPLGVFLSGGIDSSSVVAFMRQLMPGPGIKSFSIAFKEASFDESSHARRVAAFFGTDHREETLDGGRMLDILPDIAAYLDEPFADASVIPTYLLSRFARRHVTVALGGDGGDELFAGYPTFLAHKLVRWYPVPRPLHEKVVRPLADLLPASTENFSAAFKLKRFLSGLGHRPEIRNQVWLGAFPPWEQTGLLAGGVPPADPYEDILEAERHCLSGDPLERALYLTARFYLQDGVLVKVDRASMAASLEVRAPFLDHTFVEFASRLPMGLKLHGLTTKYILKKAMEKLLPPGIAGRAKKGFGIPVAKWLKGELRASMLDLLSEERLRRQGLFNPMAVTRIVRDHLEGRQDNRKPLWTLLMFQHWYDSYGRVPEALAA